MSFCPKCGEKIPHGEHTKLSVCPNCGASIASGYSWYQKEKPSRSKIILRFGIAGVFIIGAIIIGSFILLPFLAGTTTSNLHTGTDTYTDSRYPDANYGGVGYLEISNSKYENRTAFLKFDLTGISNISEIKLKLRSFKISETQLIKIYLCNNSWNGLTLTHNNSLLNNITSLSSLYVSENNQVYEWDLPIEMFKMEAEYSLVVQSLDYHETGYAYFYSNNYVYQSYRPVLSIVHSI